MRIVLLGNAGSGKTTMAKRLIGDDHIAHLSLDEIAWNAGTERKPLVESIELLDSFLDQNGQWVIEGCYGDLVEHALPRSDELWFLNPGIDACVANCRRRPWEFDKFASETEQRTMLDTLIEWVKSYELREDEFGLRRHRQLFDSYPGKKREFRSITDYEII